MNTNTTLSLLFAVIVGSGIAFLTYDAGQTFRNILMLGVLSSVGTLIVIAAIARAKQVES